jgi:A/G-specific adenine glycosylase
VVERTGGSFGPESAEALMDLGRELCLARVPRCEACPLASSCPSRGRRYEPLRKQPRFQGSFRQRRGEALRRVAAGNWSVVDDEALASLERDGLVEVRAGLPQLPR